MYHSHHLKLMATLDQNYWTAGRTDRWLRKRFRVSRIDMLSRSQCREAVKQVVFAFKSFEFELEEV